MRSFAKQSSCGLVKEDKKPGSMEEDKAANR